MEILAEKRKLRHQTLIKSLQKNIQKIHKEKLNDPITRYLKNKDYFEQALMALDDNNTKEFVHMNKKLDNKLLEETSESSEESSMMNGSRFDKVFNKIAKKERKSNNPADLLKAFVQQ